MTFKKGLAQHVDWIIAVGIFIIYFILVIIFFRPGITEAYSGEELLNTLQDNFVSEAYWDITKIPLFVEPIKYADSEGAIVEPESASDIPLVFGGKIKIERDDSGVANGLNIDDIDVDAFANMYINEGKSKVFYVKDSADDTSPYTETSEERERKFECGGNGKCLPDDFTLSLEPAINGNTRTKKMEDAKTEIIRIKERDESGKLGTVEYKTREGKVKFGKQRNGQIIVPGKLDSGKKTKYTIIYSEDDVIDAEPADYSIGEEEEHYLVCDVPDDYDQLDDTIIGTQSQCRARYVVGVPETERGIDIVEAYNYLDYNKEKRDIASHPSMGVCGASSDYECIKKVWGFPADKEFKVTIYDEKMEKIYVSFPEEIVIPSNVNVYSRQFESSILDDDGLLTPVVVQMQVF